jgi:hypothetical protein
MRTKLIVALFALTGLVGVVAVESPAGSVSGRLPERLRSASAAQARYVSASLPASAVQPSTRALHHLPTVLKRNADPKQRATRHL